MLIADIISMASAASSFWPTIRTLLPLCGRNTTAVGSLIAIASPSQAESAAGGSGQSVASSRRFKSGFLLTSAGRLPSKTIGGGLADVAARAHISWIRSRYFLAALVGEPDHLEEVVALDHAVGVVVDRLAGAGQQPGGRVVLAQDQVGVGLAALQGDPHGHLAQRAAGQRVGAAQGLRAQEDVDAEGPALADQAVEQQRDLLRDLVVLDEELLELVDDQQDARHRRARRSGLAIAVEVLARRPRR